MPEESPHIPYQLQEGVPVDFERKRLDFWLRTVPEDVRRMEYELWKRYRILHHANLFRFENKIKVGRFSIKPPYSEEQQLLDWETFTNSFLRGKVRGERFQEISAEVETDLAGIFKRYSDSIPSHRVILTALSGSSVYGPRRAGERLSDIDLNFLLDTAGPEDNLEIMPNMALADVGKPYHILATGYGEAARGPHSDIHWLLYPHYPLHNSISTEKLDDMLKALVLATRERSLELKDRVSVLDSAIAERREEDMIG